MSLYCEIDQYGHEQLEKYTEELKKLSKTYRNTHSQLKKLCSDDEYTKLYGHYEKDAVRIRT